MRPGDATYRLIRREEWASVRTVPDSHFVFVSDSVRFEINSRGKPKSSYETLLTLAFVFAYCRGNDYILQASMLNFLFSHTDYSIELKVKLLIPSALNSSI